MSAASEKFDGYVKSIADKFIDMLEKGTAPWQKSWEPGHSPAFPVSATTGLPYRGLNAMQLFLAAEDYGFKDNRWITFKAAKELGGRVKKGEHGTVGIYCKEIITPLDEKDAQVVDNSGLTKCTKRVIPCRFVVFNVEQCEGLNLPQLGEVHNWNPVDKAEMILANSNAKILHSPGFSPCYVPVKDEIRLPLRTQFKSASAYYDTALHELGHWTGHAKRLNRDLLKGGGFGSIDYAKEELRAEISSMMVASSIGLPHNTESHGAYVNSWIKVLKDDPREIMRACTAANAIKEYVLEFGKEHYYVANMDKGTCLRLSHTNLMKAGTRWADENNLLETTVAANIEAGMVKTQAELAMLRSLFDPKSPDFNGFGHKGFFFEKEPEKFIERCADVSPELKERAEKLVNKIQAIQTANELSAENTPVKPTSETPAPTPLPEVPDDTPKPKSDEPAKPSESPKVVDAPKPCEVPQPIEQPTIETPPVPTLALPATMTCFAGFKTPEMDAMEGHHYPWLWLYTAGAGEAPLPPTMYYRNYINDMHRGFDAASEIDNFDRLTDSQKDTFQRLFDLAPNVKEFSPEDTLLARQLFDPFDKRNACVVFDAAFVCSDSYKELLMTTLIFGRFQHEKDKNKNDNNIVSIEGTLNKVYGKYFEIAKPQDVDDFMARDELKMLDRNIRWGHPNAEKNIARDVYNRSLDNLHDTVSALREDSLRRMLFVISHDENSKATFEKIEHEATARLLKSLSAKIDHDPMQSTSPDLSR